MAFALGQIPEGFEFQAPDYSQTLNWTPPPTSSGQPTGQSAGNLGLGKAASGILGYGLDYLLGAGKRKQHKKDRKGLEGMIGKEVFNPYRVNNIGLNSVREDTRRYGDVIDRSIGLDTGQGMGALYSQTLGSRMGSLSQLVAQAERARSERDAQIRMALLADSR